jgi:hypothetical protein
LFFPNGRFKCLISNPKLCFSNKDYLGFCGKIFPNFLSVLNLIFLFTRLFICAYIVWAISLPCPLPPFYAFKLFYQIRSCFLFLWPPITILLLMPPVSLGLQVWSPHLAHLLRQCLTKFIQGLTSNLCPPILYLLNMLDCRCELICPTNNFIHEKCAALSTVCMPNIGAILLFSRQNCIFAESQLIYTFY